MVWSRLRLRLRIPVRSLGLGWWTRNRRPWRRLPSLEIATHRFRRRNRLRHQDKAHVCSGGGDGFVWLGPCYHKAVANPAFHGVVPALVTPFQDDERIDYSAWQTIIDTLIAAGVDGLFAAGSQGESYALGLEERIVALRFCKQAVAGRVTLYGNVGCITTRDTVQLAQQAEAIGIDAIVVVTPYYIQPSP